MSYSAPFGLLDTPPGVIDTSPAPLLGGVGGQIPVAYVYAAGVAAVGLVVLALRSRRATPNRRARRNGKTWEAVSHSRYRSRGQTITEFFVTLPDGRYQLVTGYGKTPGERKTNAIARAKAYFAEGRTTTNAYIAWK